MPNLLTTLIKSSFCTCALLITNNVTLHMHVHSSPFFTLYLYSWLLLHGVVIYSLQLPNVAQGRRKRMNWIQVTVMTVKPRHLVAMAKEMWNKKKTSLRLIYQPIIITHRQIVNRNGHIIELIVTSLSGSSSSNDSKDSLIANNSPSCGKVNTASSPVHTSALLSVMVVLVSLQGSLQEPFSHPPVGRSS